MENGVDSPRHAHVARWTHINAPRSRAAPLQSEIASPVSPFLDFLLSLSKRKKGQGGAFLSSKPYLMPFWDLSGSGWFLLDTGLGRTSRASFPDWLETSFLFSGWWCSSTSQGEPCSASTTERFLWSLEDGCSPEWLEVLLAAEFRGSDDQFQISRLDHTWAKVFTSTWGRTKRGVTITLSCWFPGFLYFGPPTPNIAHELRNMELSCVQHTISFCAVPCFQSSIAPFVCAVWSLWQSLRHFRIWCWHSWVVWGCKSRS